MEEDNGFFEKNLIVIENYEHTIIFDFKIKGFQGQITSGGVSMAAFGFPGRSFPFSFPGAKLCWSPESVINLYYCINPTTCPNQDSNLGKKTLIPK
jgi:hypothetical protein